MQLTGAKIALFDDSLAATSTNLIADDRTMDICGFDGDVTCTNAGVVTIADNAITLAMIALASDGTIITFDAT